MKIVICFLMTVALAAAGRADPIRYRWRSFGDANVDLMPLFEWWTFAAETTNQPLDITVVSPANLAAISNVWEHLPARPLADWFHIAVSEDNITVAGDMWLVDAVVAPAPMMSKHEAIYLRNPPVTELQNFKQARARYLALQNAQANQAVAAATPAWSVPTNIGTINFPGTVTTRNGVVVARSGAAAVEQQMATAATDANNAEAARMNELAALGSYLASFPATNTYYLNHFALRTGEKIKGLDVYDLGTAAGLNY